MKGTRSPHTAQGFSCCCLCPAELSEAPSQSRSRAGLSVSCPSPSLLGHSLGLSQLPRCRLRNIPSTPARCSVQRGVATPNSSSLLSSVIWVLYPGLSAPVRAGFCGGCHARTPGALRSRVPGCVALTSWDDSPSSPCFTHCSYSYTPPSTSPAGHFHDQAGGTSDPTNLYVY